MSQTVDLIVRQGATKQVRLEYGHETDGTFTPIDLTGWTAAAQVRVEEDIDSELLATFVTSIDGPAGAVTLTLPASTTLALKRDGFYDAKITHPDGTVAYLAEGRVIINRSVTA